MVLAARRLFAITEPHPTHLIEVVVTTELGTNPLDELIEVLLPFLS
jgi:hypothetical protein